jgi:hypothetical protein
MAWTDDQNFEREWHGNCVNSYGEETKQFVYAKKMGLKLTQNDKTPYNIDLKGASVLDIGGGPYSLLLKCTNYADAVVVDPCRYPEWVYARYKSAEIATHVLSGETIDRLFDIDSFIFDECWIYNVLQHVKDPQKIIQNALQYGKIVRIFEWIENGISPGHPWNLKEAELNAWLGGYGKVENINENGCRGLCYYGIFPGHSFKK